MIVLKYIFISDSKSYDYIYSAALPFGTYCGAGGTYTVISAANPCGPPPQLPPAPSPKTLATLADSIIFVGKLVSDSMPQTAYANEKWWLNKVEAWGMINDNLTSLSNDPTLNAFYNAEQNSNIGKTARVAALSRNGQSNLAQSINNSISPTGTAQTNQYYINSIYLNRLADSTYVPDSTVLANLSIIANSCPDEAGKTLYEARQMLQSHYGRHIDFTDNCSSTGARLAGIATTSNPILSTADKFNFYPNPNNGNFTVEHLLGNTFSGRVLIYDILGNLVFEKSVEKQNKVTVDLDKTKTQAGIYFLKVMNENSNLLYTKKVIVQ